MKIAMANSDPMPTEKLENLYRNLAAVVEVVAQLRHREVAIGYGGHGHHDLDNFSDGSAQEEMIVSDLIDLAHTADELENPPDFGLGDTHMACDIAHARRPETIIAADITSDFCPHRLVRRRQPRLMIRQTDSCAIEREFLVARKPLQ